MVLEPYKRALASVLLILGTASTAKQTGSAVERFQSLQVKLRESHSANDWRSNLVSANELKELLNEAPDSLLEIARADVHVDDLKAAFREIEQFTRMGQSADLLATSSDFAPLLKNANFARIQNAMKANQSLISTGSTAFQLSGFLLVCLFYPRKPPWIRLPSAKPSRKITEVHDLFRFVAFLKVTFEWLTSVHTAPRAFSLGSQRTYLWTNIALACNTSAKEGP